MAGARDPHFPMRCIRATDVRRNGRRPAWPPSKRRTHRRNHKATPDRLCPRSAPPGGGLRPREAPKILIANLTGESHPFLGICDTAPSCRASSLCASLCAPDSPQLAALYCASGGKSTNACTKPPRDNRQLTLFRYRGPWFMVVHCRGRLSRGCRRVRDLLRGIGEKPRKEVALPAHHPGERGCRTSCSTRLSSS
jgi:hypothetical protein